MLDRIRAFLLEDPIWASNASSASTHSISPLSNIDDTHDFHRIWSALQFVYCLPTRHEDDMNVEQLYGEGLNFAGCTIIRLLNEHRKFETFDFTYHLFKINRSDQKEDEVKNVVRENSIEKATYSFFCFSHYRHLQNVYENFKFLINKSLHVLINIYVIQLQMKFLLNRLNV
jgi:cytoplasmic FMR1 interacting protein